MKMAAILAFAYYRDGQNRINRRPYWNYANIEMAKIELTGGHILEFMLIKLWPPLCQ